MPLSKVLYPAAANNKYKKYAYAYRLQERLRLEHNEIGVKYREKVMTKRQWDEYLTKFEEKSNIITREILYYREQIKKNDSWDSEKLADAFE